ncbi:MAG: long-chain fatty acid--CoA ligase [Lyngbya sp.]|nr:long-chain fatty acid--CoA ligase [Lyngbya sp.]
MNIAHHIERAAKLFPHKTALIFEGKSYTYEQLNQMANRTANGLQDLGINRGDRIALFLPNIPEFVIAYLGILKLGAIAVSVNVMLKSDEVRFILNDCTAKAVFTTEELIENVPTADLPELKHIIIAEGKVNQSIRFEELIIRSSPHTQAVEMDRHAAAVIVYTSGTTGFPKGATLSHGNVISNLYSQNRCCNMTPNDRLLLYLPLFHCFGQNAILNSGLNVAATIILQRRFKLETVLETIVNEKITMFFGVPTVFIKLLHLNLNRSILDNIRLYFSAAAPLPLEVAQQWQQTYGKIIHQGYGLTETSPCACYNHDLKYQPGSIGSPIENVEMKIVDGDGIEVPPGEQGEIIIRGPNVMLGYWNLPFETARVIKNGWFHSGDIGRMDKDGYFYIVDRLKDMINVSGFKVYPSEVENVIYQHSAVAEVAVFGVDDELKGEVVHAHIVLKKGGELTEDEIEDFCSEKMATYKMPKVFKFVENIPKNPTGKILKRQLREAYQPQLMMRY